MTIDAMTHDEAENQMIRVVLPAHLRTLARVDGEVPLDVVDPVTLDSVLDALEGHYKPMRGDNA